MQDIYSSYIFMVCVRLIESNPLIKDCFNWTHEIFYQIE